MVNLCRRRILNTVSPLLIFLRTAALLGELKVVMNMHRSNKFRVFKMRLFFLVILIHCSANSAFAQHFTGPVALGVGGAGVASVEVVESSFLNPASLAHAPTFVGGIFYQDGWLEGTNHNSELAVNLVDNSKGVVFPGAFGFVQRRINFRGLESVNKRVWNLSLGNFIVPKLSGGFSFHYVETDAGGTSYDQFNMTAGILWNPHPDWGFGLAFYNLFPPDEETPLYFRDLQKLTLGTTFIASEFLRVRLDVSQLQNENPDSKKQFKGGLESFLTKFFILRVGWRSDQLAENDTLTAGFSFIGPRFTLDYAYQKSQEEGEQGPLHSVDFSIPF